MTATDTYEVVETIVYEIPARSPEEAERLLTQDPDRYLVRVEDRTINCCAEK